MKSVEITLIFSDLVMSKLDNPCDIGMPFSHAPCEVETPNKKARVISIMKSKLSVVLEVLSYHPL